MKNGELQPRGPADSLPGGGGANSPVTQTWLIGHVGRYHPYDPEDFDPATVDFDDPQERWLRAWDDR